MNKKVIAFYLPQFHTIPENDIWWGKGFTEWSNTKKAKPLYKGHDQPKIPFNNHHYDLADVSEMERQSTLAKQYGVDAFCYYHYWFKGHKLLNTPLENMLKNKDVNIPFCLSWANEPWTRAWDGSEKEILMAQDYGNEGDWGKHLEYLLPFFKDERYLKVDGNFLFLVYRTSSFDGFDKMIDFWNSELRNLELPEIFIVETLNTFQSKPFCKKSSAVLEFEPMFTLNNDYSYLEKKIWSAKKIIFDKGLFKISYKNLYSRILKRKASNVYDNKKLFKSCFVDWDNTARKGKRGMVVVGGSPENFKRYFKQIYNSDRSEFLFINAWNEWAEGTYLEPDTKHGFKYLQAIFEVKSEMEGTK